MPGLLSAQPRGSGWTGEPSGVNTCGRSTRPRHGFVMENVPGYSGRPSTQFLVRGRRARIPVDGQILNAADYGVPQTRKRAIVIGSR